MKNNIEKFKKWFQMNPPASGTFEDWEKFHNDCKENYPKRHWLNEEAIPKIEQIGRLFIDIKNGIKYRTYDKYHIIDTKLKPSYYDVDTRLLHGVFSLLVDFVEIEKAWMQLISNDKNFSSLKKFKSRELGLQYLDWEITLTFDDTIKPTPQAENAQVIKDIYLWWMDVRSKRMDPYNLLDNPELETVDDMFKNLKNNDPKRKEIYDQISKLEEEYHNEDTKMLIKLIEIRGSLWT